MGFARVAAVVRESRRRWPRFDCEPGIQLLKEIRVSVESIRMLSSMATREILSRLVAAYADIPGTPLVQLESAGGVDVASRVQSGDAVDIVVLAGGAIDQLIASGQLREGSRVDLARSGMGVAVKSGGPHPDIRSEAALRQAILAARSLGYSTGPSGNHLVKTFERWGIQEQIASRIVQAPAGVSVATLVARGDAELGFQQLSELLHVPGVEVLGPMPGDTQSVTTFSAAMSVACNRAPEVRALLEFLAGSQADAIKREQGMEPA